MKRLPPARLLPPHQSSSMKNDYSKIIKSPIFFERNRVFRVYTGGMLFSDFFGDPAEDGNMPEEWVASSVKAINRDRSNELDGVSMVRGTDIPFSSLLEKERVALLGQHDKLGILVKLLDSAIRLPIQAHPDKDFSRKHFNSGYGKTESWLILATRPGAHIYLGFKEPLTKTAFSELVEKSRSDPKAMEHILSRIDVKPGDIFIIPPKTVHAIGPGCLILETQEPTDFTIQPEYRCGDYLLINDEMYIGLDKDTALDCFDFSLTGENAYKKAKCEPQFLSDKNGCRSESLIGLKDTLCFSVKRHRIKSGFLYPERGPSIFIVTDGEGEISTADGSSFLRKGDYFFLPHAVTDCRIRSHHGMEIIECAQ